MNNTLEKELQQTSAHSTATCAFNSSSWRNSSVSQIPHSSVSWSASLDMESPNYHCHNVKQLGLQLQDQDSSSTQSTCESHQEMATNGRGKLHGYDDANGRGGDNQVKSVYPPTAPYVGFSPAQMDYNQSMARVPYPYAEPYYGGLASPYGAQAIGPMQIPPQTMGMASTRVPLPLDLAEEEPIFVNAKQYRAILRRRESRAKLEAQNKLAKARKPYLHESRHLHALKRVRGSGGRFVNTKNQQEQHPSTNTNVQNESEMAYIQAGEYFSESDSGKAGASTAACSDTTSISNADNYKFQRQSDLRLSGYPLPPHNGGSGGGTVMNNNVYQHHRGVHIIR